MGIEGFIRGLCYTEYARIELPRAVWELKVKASGEEIEFDIELPRAVWELKALKL